MSKIKSASKKTEVFQPSKVAQANTPSKSVVPQ